MLFGYRDRPAVDTTWSINTSNKRLFDLGLNSIMALWLGFAQTDIGQSATTVYCELQDKVFTIVVASLLFAIFGRQCDLNTQCRLK